MYDTWATLVPGQPPFRIRWYEADPGANWFMGENCFFPLLEHKEYRDIGSVIGDVLPLSYSWYSGYNPGFVGDHFDGDPNNFAGIGPWPDDAPPVCSKVLLPPDGFGLGHTSSEAAESDGFGLGEQSGEAAPPDGFGLGEQSSEPTPQDGFGVGDSSTDPTLVWSNCCGWVNRNLCLEIVPTPETGESCGCVLIDRWVSLTYDDAEEAWLGTYTTCGVPWDFRLTCEDFNEDPEDPLWRFRLRWWCDSVEVTYSLGEWADLGPSSTCDPFFIPGFGTESDFACGACVVEQGLSFVVHGPDQCGGGGPGGLCWNCEVPTDPGDNLQVFPLYAFADDVCDCSPLNVPQPMSRSIYDPCFWQSDTFEFCGAVVQWNYYFNGGNHEAWLYRVSPFPTQLATYVWDPPDQICTMPKELYLTDPMLNSCVWPASILIQSI